MNGIKLFLLFLCFFDIMAVRYEAIACDYKQLFNGESMLIRFAQLNDLHFLEQHDKHISEAELINAIKREHILIAEKNGEAIGWLRYNYFWDNIPFMNMLFVLSEHRGNLYGTNLIAYWENQMKLLGFHTVMTSTQANEYAQHLYHKLGYNTIGGFMLGSEPYELILSKEL